MKTYIIAFIVFMIAFFVITGLMNNDRHIDRNDSRIPSIEQSVKLNKNKVVTNRAEYTNKISKVRGLDKNSSIDMFDSTFVADTASTEVTVRLNQVVEANVLSVRLDSSNAMLESARDEVVLKDSIISIDKDIINKQEEKITKNKHKSTILTTAALILICAGGLTLLLK